MKHRAKHGVQADRAARDGQGTTPDPSLAAGEEKRPEDNSAASDSAHTPKSKKWTLHPTYNTLTGFAIVLIITTLWVFVLGFMTGKGQNPNQKIRQLTGFEQPVSKKEAKEQTLPNIAEQTPLPTTQVVPAPQPKTPVVAQALPQKTAEQEKAAPQAPKYAFVYQIAAFKVADKENVNKITKSLNAAGYRTKVEKRGSLNFILVHLRGTEDDAAQLRAYCQKIRLGSPLMRTKTTISARKKK